MQANSLLAEPQFYVYYIYRFPNNQLSLNNLIFTKISFLTVREISFLEEICPCTNLDSRVQVS